MLNSDIEIVISYEMGSFLIGFCFGYSVAIFHSLAALIVNFK